MANNNSKPRNGRQTQSRAAAQRAAMEKAKKHETINRIGGVSLFAVSIIFFFIAIISGEGLWHILHNCYVGMFGMLAACIFPVLTIAITILYSLKEREPYKFIAKGIESIIMVLLISAFIHIIQNQTGEKLGFAIEEAFTSASDEFNGGFFGAIIGWLLLTLGKAPAIIVDLVLIFVDFMLLTGITIIQFFKGAAKPATDTYKKVAPVINERIEQRRLQKGNVDVPLDINPPGGEAEPKPKKSKKADVKAKGRKGKCSENNY